MQTGFGPIGSSSALGEEAPAHYIRSGGSFWLKLFLTKNTMPGKFLMRILL